MSASAWGLERRRNTLGQDRQPRTMKMIRLTQNSPWGLHPTLAPCSPSHVEAPSEWRTAIRAAAHAAPVQSGYLTAYVTGRNVSNATRRREGPPLWRQQSSWLHWFLAPKDPNLFRVRRFPNTYPWWIKTFGGWCRYTCTLYRWNRMQPPSCWIDYLYVTERNACNDVKCDISRAYPLHDELTFPVAGKVRSKSHDMRPMKDPNLLRLSTIIGSAFDMFCSLRNVSV